DFAIFAKVVAGGGVVRAVPAPKCGSRAICDRMNSWAQGEGAPGMGYMILGDGEARGPIANRLSPEAIQTLKERTGTDDGDAILFAAGKPGEAAKLAGNARIKLADDHSLREEGAFRLCWIVDYPMFEADEVTGEIEFSHNPFSMPQGGLEALETMDPLDILAYQYDIVCNGVELSSGAIRNHLPDVMYKAFDMAGYDKSAVDDKFRGMINAFKFGAPPHGGIAPGIDRIVMMLADEPNIREVIMFPMNQRAEDLMMGAPSEADPKHLRDLYLKTVAPPPPADKG
ncbi:MAG: aspartate--tRNA ligase, partial [Rhodospirillaceae bacterium]|nr:aspartate--tRNA ligase [Rhodospirillaceae bacterium]